MSQQTKWVLIIALFVLLSTDVAFAQAGYSLVRWSVDSGGQQSKEGSFTMRSVIGRLDVGTYRGGSFSVRGGFLLAQPSDPHLENVWRIYLPFVQR